MLILHKAMRTLRSTADASSRAKRRKKKRSVSTFARLAAASKRCGYWQPPTTLTLHFCVGVEAGVERLGVAKKRDFPWARETASMTAVTRNSFIIRNLVNRPLLL